MTEKQECAKSILKQLLHKLYAVDNSVVERYDSEFQIALYEDILDFLLEWSKLSKKERGGISTKWVFMNTSKAGKPIDLGFGFVSHYATNLFVDFYKAKHLKITKANLGEVNVLATKLVKKKRVVDRSNGMIAAFDKLTPFVPKCTITEACETAIEAIKQQQWQAINIRFPSLMKSYYDDRNVYPDKTVYKLAFQLCIVFDNLIY